MSGQRKYRAKTHYKKKLGDLSTVEVENDKQLQLLMKWIDALKVGEY